jgi:hypothetical protein
MYIRTSLCHSEMVLLVIDTIVTTVVEFMIRWRVDVVPIRLAIDLTKLRHGRYVITIIIIYYGSVTHVDLAFLVLSFTISFTHSLSDTFSEYITRPCVSVSMKSYMYTIYTFEYCNVNIMMSSGHAIIAETIIRLLYLACTFMCIRTRKTHIYMT